MRPKAANCEDSVRRHLLVNLQARVDHSRCLVVGRDGSDVSAAGEARVRRRKVARKYHWLLSWDGSRAEVGQAEACLRHTVGLGRVLVIASDEYFIVKTRTSADHRLRHR